MKIIKYRKHIKNIIGGWTKLIKNIFRSVRTFLLLPTTIIDTISDPVHMGSWNLRLSCPLDKPLMQAHYRLMKIAGWERYLEKLSDPDNSWYPYQRFSKEITTKFTARVEFVYFDHNEGSTCMKKAIGTEMVEETIYEIVCKEGATEGAI